MEHVAGMRSAYTVIVERPEGKRPLGSSRCGWENSIKIDLKEIWCEVWTECNWWPTFMNTEMIIGVHCGKFHVPTE